MAISVSSSTIGILSYKSQKLQKTYTRHFVKKNQTLRIAGSTVIYLSEV